MKSLFLDDIIICSWAKGHKLQAVGDLLQAIYVIYHLSLDRIEMHTSIEEHLLF
jgi:hypothetical protein